MTERPILFSGPMVRAILEGHKTQTRRVIKPPFEFIAGGYLSKPRGNERFTPYICPYGQVGDLLYVRETWAEGNSSVKVFYRADADEDGTVPYLVSNAGGYGGGVGNARVERWKPSIHMPRWASRINLEITDIQVQRLQEISIEDAAAEGFESSGEMMEIWDSINAKRGFGWDTNPWCWKLEFKRVDNA